MWILHSISFLWCTSYGNCPGENKSSTFIWLNLIQARLNTKQCWPAISINNHIWDRSLGICSWLDLVILQYFCWGQSSLELPSHAVIFICKTLPRGSECGDAWWLLLTGLSWLHSLPPHGSLTSPHPSIGNVFNCEVKQQGWFLITLLSRLKTLISFPYTLVKNEGELHWVRQREQIPGTLPFQVALSCLSFSPGFDHLWLLMGGFQPNQEPEIRKEFEGKLFEPSFVEECTKPNKRIPNPLMTLSDMIQWKNRLSELQTEAKLSQSQSIVIGLFFHFYF